MVGIELDNGSFGLLIHSLLSLKLFKTVIVSLNIKVLEQHHPHNINKMLPQNIYNFYIKRRKFK